MVLARGEYRSTVTFYQVDIWIKYNSQKKAFYVLLRKTDCFYSGYRGEKTTSKYSEYCKYMYFLMGNPSMLFDI